MRNFTRSFLLTLLLGLTALAGTARSLTDLSADEPVRLESQYYGTGAVVLGEQHGSTALLYYLAGDTSADDGWWYVRSEGEGYVFVNAKTGQYMTYTTDRIEDVQKGITLTDASQGSLSQWKLEEQTDGTIKVASVYAPDQYFNQRIDGTYLLGTYTSESGANERFKLYDKNGEAVTLPTQGGGTTDPSAPTTLADVIDTLRVTTGELTRTAVYDGWQKAYLLPVDTLLRHGGELSLQLTPQLKAGLDADSYAGAVLSIEGAQAAGDGTLTIASPTCAKPYTLTLTAANGTVLATGALQLTYLPVVDMQVSEYDLNGTTYTNGTLRVVTAEAETPDEVLNAKFRYRGATAQTMAKKAFAVKIIDADGKSLDHAYFGLREDNNWILDAMAVDAACMRNRVSFDLWNDFSTPPYYKADEKKALTGTRGRFVEVILNGKYQGLYCMTEKLDRKQLKLKKYKEAKNGNSEEIHGLLYKTEQWSYEVLMGHYLDNRDLPGRAPSAYNNTLGQETWAQYELQYPDYEEEAVDWEPMWNGVNFVATSTQDEFDAKVKDYFDYPALRDYYLFIELMLATDNHGKNMFWYVYDKQSGKYGQKLGLTPWDLDGTWGGRWDGSTYICSPTQDFDTFIWNYEHGQLTTYIKLAQSTTIDWAGDLKARYAELRKTYFSEQSLTNRFASYASLFADSYADNREERRWADYDFYNSDHRDLQGAATYIEQWIPKRLAALDEKYGYDPNTSTGIETAGSATPYLGIAGGSRSLAVTAGQPLTTALYSADGRLVRALSLRKGLNTVGALTPGIYLLAGQKVVVRP